MASEMIVTNSVRQTHSLLRAVLLVAGWLALLLGAAGVLLPILPTAPFLLLALACFSRSSDTMTRRMYRMPVVGSYLRDWQEDGISPRMKWTAIGALWIAAVATLLTIAKTALFKTVVVLVALLTTLHFLLVPVRGRRGK